MPDGPLAPGSTIAIMGGGQLGRMLSAAAARLGFRTRIFCDRADAPAFSVSSDHVYAAYADEAALRRFAEGADVITYEFENIPFAAIETVSAIAPVHPCPGALTTTQDRLHEKQFLRAQGIPTAAFARIDSLADLERAAADGLAPGFLKTRRLGYDGKGQARLETPGDCAAAWSAIAGAPAILEAAVPFLREASIIAVRAGGGGMVYYDLTENRHADQILRESRVPCTGAGQLTDQARDIATRIAGAFDYVGTLAVEFFAIEADGGSGAPSLVVNEIAPRVHNSGHWTLDAARIDQFENHIRAVAGWPLGSTSRLCDAMMRNLIGKEVDDWLRLAGEPDCVLHVYGKAEARAGRKMGHVTRLVPFGDAAARDHGA